MQDAGAEGSGKSGVVISGGHHRTAEGFAGNSPSFAEHTVDNAAVTFLNHSGRWTCIECVESRPEAAAVESGGLELHFGFLYAPWGEAKIWCGVGGKVARAGNSTGAI